MLAKSWKHIWVGPVKSWVSTVATPIFDGISEKRVREYLEEAELLPARVRVFF